MDIIKNNPYRIIGILVGTSTKEEHSKTKKLKMYIEAGQDVPEDFSFPIIGPLNRDIDNVDDAISKLNLNSDRVNASLFWFYNGNTITDEPVFDDLKASKEEAKEALGVWIKLTAADEVTKRNASAFQNLSTLRLINVFGSFGKHNFKKLEKGISLKLKFLESDYVNDFIRLSADETFKFSKENLQIIFLDQVYKEIKKYASTEIIWYMNFLNSISFIAKEKYLTEFIKEPIEKLKEQLEKSKINRKTNEVKAYDFGKSLYELSQDFLPVFQNILGKDNIQYSSIADKFSDEILQCGIVYFKKYRDTNTDPSDKAMDLFIKAKKLAVGSIAIQRCQENSENLQEWIDDKPERDLQNKINTDFTALIAIFDRFENKAETIENARVIINLCKPHLINIKNTLGASDEMYLKLSTRVASQSQSYIIEEVNKAQTNFGYKVNLNKDKALLDLSRILIKGLEVTNLIGTLDMEQDFKINRFNPNKETLVKLCNQISESLSIFSPFQSSNTSRSSYTPPKSNSSDINWGGWIFGIILFFIVVKSCSAANKNNYDNDTAIDTSAVAVDTTAVAVDTTAVVLDTSAIIQPEENYSSPYIGNQLSNGSSPLDDCFGSGNYQGNATLTIKNGGNSDAIVCLYSISKDRTIRNEYVQKNSSFTMSNISQGYYKIRVFYGNDWNPSLENSCGTKGNFESNVNFSEFDGEEYFEDSSRGYTNATVTLYTVANGNASSSSIDQSSFFNK